jgi:hypothetical protein
MVASLFDSLSPPALQKAAAVMKWIQLSIKAYARIDF